MQQDVVSNKFTPSPYIHRMKGEAEVMGIYVITNAKGESEKVSAQTASEAIRKTKIKNPVKVLRYNPLRQVLISGDEFHFHGIEAPADNQKMVSESVSPPPTPMQETVAAAAPVSEVSAEEPKKDTAPAASTEEDVAFIGEDWDK